MNQQTVYTLGKKWGKPIKSLLNRMGYGIHRLEINAYGVQQLLLSRVQVGTIFDVGANKGAMIDEYRSRFPSAMVYGFEPLREEYLNLLLRKYKNDDLVFPVPFAVSDKEGRDRFYINQERASSSLLPTVENASYYFDIPDIFKGTDTTKVQTVTLDGFCEREVIKKIDILKMDIQGAELPALRGARNMLESSSILLIYSETMFLNLYEGQPAYYKICEFLDQYDYRLFNWYNLYHSKSNELVTGDAIFISPKLREILQGMKDMRPFCVETRKRV